MCKFFFTIASFSVLTLPLQAQSTTEDVADVVDRFFDGMRAGDSTVVRSVLHPEARFLTTAAGEGTPKIHVGSIEKFLEAVGAPHDEIWDERIWNLDIRHDDRLATAWMNYAFYVGEEFSHCGVNAFQFFHGEDGWRVIQITDTRRSSGCDLPEDE